MYLTKAQNKFLGALPAIPENDAAFRAGLKREVFSVTHVPLSYRQVNELGKAGIIQENRKEDKKGWRKFNLIEAIYLSVIAQLKDAGLTNKQIEGFKNSFYKTKELEKVFYLVFAGENIILNIDSDGKPGYYDWLYFAITYKKVPDFNFNVTINLYKIAEGFLDQKPENFFHKSFLKLSLDKCKQELKEYTDERGMKEEEANRLAERIYELGDVLFERWIADKKRKKYGKPKE